MHAHTTGMAMKFSLTCADLGDKDPPSILGVAIPPPLLRSLRYGYKLADIMVGRSVGLFGQGEAESLIIICPNQLMVITISLAYHLT